MRGGEGGIRTLEDLHLTAFRERPVQPLLHLSSSQEHYNRDEVYTKGMKDSIFTKIIKGEIPSHKVYEDENTLAIMDIASIQRGQVVVVPKKQVGFVWDMTDEDYTALMLIVKKVGTKLREVFPEKERVGFMVEGLEVTDHAHVKVFPFSKGEFRNLPTGAAPDHDDLAQLAEKLRIR